MKVRDILNKVKQALGTKKTTKAIESLDEAIDKAIMAFKYAPQEFETFQMLKELAVTNSEAFCQRIKSHYMPTDQDDVDWWGIISWIHEMAGDYVAAVEALAKALAKSNNKAYYKKIADLLVYLGLFDLAIVIENKFFQYYRAKPIDKERHAMLLAEMGTLDSALNEFNDLIKIQPNNSFAFYNSGRILYEQGKYDEAIGCFNRAEELDNTNALIYLYKGMGLSKIGREPEAQYEYERILKTEGELQYRNIVLPLALCLCGHKEQATAIADEILGTIKEAESIKEFAKSLMYLSVAYYKMDYREKAVDCMKLAVDNGDRSLWYYEHGALLAPLRNNPEFTILINKVKETISGNHKLIDPLIKQL
jgi:tetratricopeptide (TPR) repeat protein